MRDGVRSLNDGDKQIERRVSEGGVALDNTPAVDACCCACWRRLSMLLVTNVGLPGHHCGRFDLRPPTEAVKCRGFTSAST